MQKIICHISILIFLIGFLCKNSNAQNLHPDTLFRKIENIQEWLFYRNHDSNYIKNLANKKTFKIILLNKFNYFKIRDKNHKTTLHYRPAKDLNFGFGFTYKWVALDMTIGLGLWNKDDFEESKSFDFRGRIFSGKQYIAATMQYYFGYKLPRISGKLPELSSSSTIRPDVRKVNFEFHYLYALNYDKFSLKAPFVFNEMQRKSAGSFLAGASFHIYILDADSSLVPKQISPYFNDNLHLKDLNVVTLTANFGYMYTLVYEEHYFLTLGLIPGLNINFGDYLTDYRNDFTPNVNIKFNTMNSVGYNSETFFGGIHFMQDLYGIRIKQKSKIITGDGLVALFFGYRL